MTNFRWSRVFTVCILALMIATPAHALRWFTWIDELSGPGRFNGYQFNGEVLCIGSRPDQAALFDLTTQIRTMAKPLDAAKLINQEMATIAGSGLVSAAAVKGLLNQYVSQQDQLSEKIEAINRKATIFPLCRSDRQNTVTAIVFEYGRFDDKHSEHEDKYTGVTRLSNAQLIAYLPLHRLLGAGVPPTRITRGVEFGAGAGFYHLTGTTVKNTEEWMPAIPLRIRIIPAEFFYKDPGNRADTGSTKRHLWQALQFKVGWDYIPTKARWNELLQSTGGGTGFENNDSQELVATWGFQLDLGQVAWALFGKEPTKK